MTGDEVNSKMVVIYSYKIFIASQGARPPGWRMVVVGGGGESLLPLLLLLLSLLLLLL